jgi:hypothetical protein
MLTRPLFFASLFALALPACGGLTSSGDGASIDDDIKADHAGGGTTYYLIRTDANGASFVKRANFASTTCADGTAAAECSVPGVDYSPAQLDQNDMSLLAGRPMIVRGSLSSTGLSAREVWVAAVGTAGDDYAPVSGTIYRVKDNGVRCVTAPCPSDRETKLNGTTTKDVAGVDLTRTGASDEQINDAYLAIASADGVFVDGSNVALSGKYQQLVATNFFTRVAHAAGTAGKTCGSIAGLTCGSNQWCDPTPANACGGVDLAGTCQQLDVACSQLWAPVCGCDGKTYSNDCTRITHQVQLAHTGACAN